MEEALIPEVPTVYMPPEMIKTPISNLKQGQFGWITTNEVVVSYGGEVFVLGNAYYGENRFLGACIRIQRLHDQMVLECLDGTVFSPIGDFTNLHRLIGVAEIKRYVG